jgi:hypothetical protein
MEPSDRWFNEGNDSHDIYTCDAYGISILNAKILEDGYFSFYWMKENGPYSTLEYYKNIGENQPKRYSWNSSSKPERFEVNKNDTITWKFISGPDNQKKAQITIPIEKITKKSLTISYLDNTEPKLNDIMNHSNSIYYMEDNHYDKSLSFGANTNNIKICPNPNDRLNEDVVFDNLNGDFCIHLIDTSNIEIKDLVFYDGNYSIIIENCNNITINNNDFFNFNKAGILVINSSDIDIWSNNFESSCSNCTGIIFINSNSTSSNPTIVKDNSFGLPDNCKCIGLTKSCGNYLYELDIKNEIKYFREDNIQFGLDNGICACNNEATRFRLTNNDERMAFYNKFCNNWREG